MKNNYEYLGSKESVSLDLGYPRIAVACNSEPLGEVFTSTDYKLITNSA